ncbi:hypothetical protein NDU88_005187 [Pleurodeles waltl]|uniref:Uncharacterized protein n=1 Tax=Pleurodeles waltl TaxID=8319 RepID=A0AAV7SKZ0_PLEWA|nr:hypothetical protein NDU88_005187 [Pleurodeles waltl]
MRTPLKWQPLLWATKRVCLGCSGDNNLWPVPLSPAWAPCMEKGPERLKRGSQTPAETDERGLSDTKQTVTGG